MRKARYDEVIELRAEVERLRGHLSGLETRMSVLGSVAMPIGATTRCFPTLPRAFSPVAWLPWDGTTALTWWFDADDIPPRARHLVLHPTSNVVEGTTGQGKARTFVRFTVHDAEEEASIRSQESPIPTTMLLYIGTPIPKAYKRSKASAGPPRFELL
jgi:hypothetical protein